MVCRPRVEPAQEARAHRRGVERRPGCRRAQIHEEGYGESLTAGQRALSGITCWSAETEKRERGEGQRERRAPRGQPEGIGGGRTRPRSQGDARGWQAAAQVEGRRHAATCCWVAATAAGKGYGDGDARAA